MPEGEVEAALVHEKEISDTGTDQILEATDTGTPEEAARVDVAHVSGIRQDDAITDNADEAETQEDGPLPEHASQGRGGDTGDSEGQHQEAD